jgi:aminoglycoside phosphotransferase (APT) family kinase protein
VAPKAHDMAREYRVLQAIHPHFRRRRSLTSCARTRVCSAPCSL